MSHLVNSKTRFGWVSIILHWTSAVTLIGLYFSGDYMVELGYYDIWYNRAPQIHKEVGVIIGLLMVFRLLWNTLQTKPKAIGNDKPIIKLLVHLAHYLLYALVFILIISGYLVSTAKGQGIDVFGLFEVPVFFANNKDRAELAGDVHEWLALGFILLVALHACAALMHHFIHKDNTLKRMLGISKTD